MARTKRICPAGDVFHVLNRAVARLTIFEKPEDYAAFMLVAKDWQWSSASFKFPLDCGSPAAALISAACC